MESKERGWYLVSVRDVIDGDWVAVGSVEGSVIASRTRGQSRAEDTRVHLLVERDGLHQAVELTGVAMAWVNRPRSEAPKQSEFFTVE